MAPKVRNEYKLELETLPQIHTNYGVRPGNW